ncbi:MAG: hypothetical protein EHM55_14170 [Acidobacteria bacterium]|nr:MAG: hypothetical protein EHM55_14170 [Acidobacteriota bacterium]
MIYESAGARPPGSRQFTDPFSGETYDISATAQTPRSMQTAIRADLGEAQAYRQALMRGEI